MDRLVQIVTKKRNTHTSLLYRILTVWCIIHYYEREKLKRKEKKSSQTAKGDRNQTHTHIQSMSQAVKSLNRSIFGKMSEGDPRTNESNYY